MSLNLPDDLMHSSVFPHPADKVELIETHISWVLLAGDHAYKIKKPVNFGFLDFSTREKRRAACLEELRINRRTAPMLYEALVCISDNPVEIHQDSRDPPAEYAIRMRRFAQSALLPSVLNNHPDTLSLMDDLASHVAGFHATADIAGTGSSYGTPDSVLAPVQQNVAQLRRQINDPALLGIIDSVEQWTQTAFTRLKSMFAERQTSGHVRECHGDMHLGNIVVLDGKPLLFDALEFNASLRWIDRMSDVAFLVMDLQMNAHPDLGWHFLNKWLESTGDYQGLRLLPWYLCYRAMVRAKVAALRLAQLEGDARLSALAQCRAYLELAERYTRPQARALIINHGLSGSGKTTHSQYLVDHCSLIRIRADVERKRLFGLHAAESSQRIAGGIYTKEANLRTQAHLEQLAQTVLEAGYPVLVDATFIRREPRERMRAVATALQTPWLILIFEAAPATLCERTARRAASGHDASEATADVVANQMEHYEPLAENEQSAALIINTDTPPDWSCLLPVFCARTRLRSVFD